MEMKLKEALEKILADLKLDMKVIVKPILKGNRMLTGFAIGKNNIYPVVYMEDYEHLFYLGYDFLAREMLKTILSNDVFQFDNTIMTWEYAQNNLIFCVAPKETNKECVTCTTLDLEFYIRVKVSENQTYKVSNEILKMWGIEKGFLFYSAVKNFEQYVITGITEKSFGCRQGSSIYDFQYDPSKIIYVATNKIGMYGASILWYDMLLGKIANEIGDDLYILPSSIHEILIVPASKHTLDEMTIMVQEVNEQEVEPEERLANHAYIFHRETMKLTLT